MVSKSTQEKTLHYTLFWIMCSGIFENRIIAQNNIAALEKRAAID